MSPHHGGASLLSLAGKDGCDPSWYKDMGRASQAGRWEWAGSVWGEWGTSEETALTRLGLCWEKKSGWKQGPCTSR